jgi:prepilin-type N-terminal cleavage/methylation domain-containing protein
MFTKVLRLLKFPNRKGFTLIELLVVLGILGVLAAVLLAAINPVEQLKKAQDSSMKEVATEFVSGNVSYYSTHNALPWYTVANGGANCYTGGAIMSAVALSSLNTCISSMVSVGELKASYLNSPNMSQIVITDPNPQTGNASDIVACFQPQSQSQQLDPNTKYSQTGALATNCKSQGGANLCYWCAQ